MKIGNLDTRQRVLIIAEIGNNHEGDLGVARELVRQAAAAGADGVKFQTFQTEAFVNPAEPERVARMKSFELSPKEFADLRRIAGALGLLFLSTPLDLSSVAVLEPLVDAFKIASGDNDFLPLIERASRTGKPLIVSSGVSDLEQLRRTGRFIERCQESHGRRAEWAVLHCVSNYPTRAADAHLRSIESLRRGLSGAAAVGYSDHTLGIEACVLAIGLGARIIEKHFTLDRNYSDFRDHAIAADPAELAELVRRIRLAEKLLGMPEKRLLDCEREMAAAIRRSIVAARRLPAGHRITASDLIWMRPGGGLPPGEEAQLIGTQLKRAVERGERIRLGDVA